MDLYLYNTLSRTKEKFVPIKPQIGIYTCGPTVYSYAHIGNLRTYVFMDILRRILEYNNYQVYSVMNITDVGHLLDDADDGDDKLEVSARQQNKTPLEIADIYTKQFLKDISSLNILTPSVIPKATDNISQMIDIVAKLIELGYAYETDDGVYYEVSKFSNYGKLSRANLENQLSGARVELNEHKRNPLDFAIWKKADANHIMQWNSPWGMGYPGWHIECTAMSLRYLGDKFDIHTGGVDHIPIHHENEIAQGEAYTGHKMTNYWLHSEFMLYDGGKMSKSLGNNYTLTQLLDKGYKAVEFRYFCLNAQYRQKLNFTFEGLDSARVAYNRLLSALKLHSLSSDKTDKELLFQYENEFHTAINDDLNAPMALGVLWKMVKHNHSSDIYDLALKFDKVLALDLDKLSPDNIEIPKHVQELLNQRKTARANKDFALSDQLRDKISQLGYTVKDSKQGQEIVKN